MKQQAEEREIYLEQRRYEEQYRKEEL